MTAPITLRDATAGSVPRDALFGKLLRGASTYHSGYRTG